MEAPPSRALDNSVPEAFNARAFLDDFRATMLQTGQVTKAVVKAEHRNRLQKYLPDAQAVAQQQIERTKRMLPGNTPEAFLNMAQSYTEAFTCLSHNLGLAALRLADKGIDRFAEPLHNRASRLLIFRSLATDLRAIVWQLGDRSIASVSRSTFKNKAALYYPASAIKQLSEQFPEFTATDFRQAIIGRPKNPKGFLDSTVMKMSELRADSRYKNVLPGVIKYAAFNHVSAPESYLDNVIPTMKELTANPRFKVFYPTRIAGAVLNNPHTAAHSLEIARQRYDNLREDPRYAHIANRYISDLVLQHAHPRKVLSDAVEKIGQLIATGRYDEFGKGRITEAVFRRPVAPEKYFDDIITEIDAYKADPAFAVLRRSTVRQAIIRYGKDAKEVLLKIVAEKLAQDQAFE